MFVRFANQKSPDALGVKSFEEIMRKKREKLAALVNAGDKKSAKPAAGEHKRTAPASTDSSSDVAKTRSASAPKYKFTPIVFDVERNSGGTASSGSGRSKRRSVESRVDAETRQTRQSSATNAAAEVTSTDVADVTDVPLAVQLSVPSTPDVTPRESPATSDKSDPRTTPVIKRQSSSSTPSSDLTKKRRTSVESRWIFVFGPLLALWL